MKNIKPLKINEQRTEKEGKQIKSPVPQKIKNDLFEFAEEIDKEESLRFNSIKKAGSLAKKTIVILSLFILLLLTGLFYDIGIRIDSMLSHAPILGIAYLFGVVLLTGIIFYVILKQYLGYVKLKKVGKLQEESLKYLEKPDKNVIEYAKKILEHYQTHNDETIQKNVKKTKEKLDSLIYEEVLESLKHNIFDQLDNKAKKIISKYSNQTAISTAISPVALIDAILVLSRSYAMVHDIAKLYGYKPNFIGEILLFKKVLFTLAFASITELITHHMHDFIGSSMISKLSYHSAQGIANGILTARIGLAAIKVCRPIAYQDNSEGFLKNLSKKLINIVFSKTTN